MNQYHGLRILVFAPYREVTGETIRFNQLLGLLSQIKIDRALFAAAQINWLLQKRGMNPDTQKALAQKYVELSLRQGIDGWTARQWPKPVPLPIIFHRQQLLAVMRWAGTVFSDVGQDLDPLSKPKCPPPPSLPQVSCAFGALLLTVPTESR